MQHDVSVGMAAAALPLEPTSHQPFRSSSFSFFFFFCGFVFTKVGALKNIKVAMFVRFALLSAVRARALLRALAEKNRVTNQASLKQWEKDHTIKMKWNTSAISHTPPSSYSVIIFKKGGETWEKEREKEKKRGGGGGAFWNNIVSHFYVRGFFLWGGGGGC